MSELMNAGSGGRDFRWQLLTTVSALALFAAVCGSGESEAADQDADRPTLWIELGGQLDHVSGQAGSFAPAFLAANSSSPVLQPVSPLQAQNPPPFSFAEEGKITFQPENSNWAFSVAINYGRSSNFRHVDHQTNRLSHEYNSAGIVTATTSAADFANTQVHRHESHAIVDFSVGKDVGLGLFGGDGSSTLGLGIRFAQFATKATFDVRARPNLHVKYFPSADSTGLKVPLAYFHNYHATGYASRGFHGIGPAVSWSGSAPFTGNLQQGEITFDWGVNAAILFGRQKTRVRHQESGQYVSALDEIRGSRYAYAVDYQNPVGGHSGARSIVVPNVGGLAGASWRLQNFKASLGYRADLFFGAIDGGIDTPKRTTTGFYGPFVSIAIGIGR